jgi:hypothetical protein
VTRSLTVVLAIVGDLIAVLFRSRAAVIAENLFLRRQLALYLERKTRRRRPSPATKFALVGLSRFFPWASALAIVKPDTFVRWHRAGFRLFWRWKSRHVGRPPLPKSLRALIVTMAGENPSWGEGRIADELSLKLGLFVDPRTVGKYLKQGGASAATVRSTLGDVHSQSCECRRRLRLVHLGDRYVSSLVRLYRDRNRFAADSSRQCDRSSDCRLGPTAVLWVPGWRIRPSISHSRP